VHLEIWVRYFEGTLFPLTLTLTLSQNTANPSPHLKPNPNSSTLAFEQWMEIASRYPL